MMKPGADAPILMDNIVDKTPKKVTRFTELAGNQLVANLLGVFMIKILPKAFMTLPIRTYLEFPSSISSLSHTPPIVKTPPRIKFLCIPNRFKNQLQGKAERGWMMLKRRALRVISVALMLKILSTATLMLEKVCIAMQLTRAARKYRAAMG